MVDPDDPARLEAYRQAAQDARRRAETYAEALGLRLRAVESLEEPDSRRWPTGDMEVVHTAALQSGGAEAAVPVNLGTINVQAMLNATFALEGSVAE